MEALAKYCIFCGEQPEEKTKEHVLPHWLIALTGDPKRKAFFGFNISNGNSSTRREFAFDAFTFPACSKCNHNYSDLEKNTKQIFEKLFNQQKISVHDVSLLLDWFDKVRIGLWLGFNQLNRNITNIRPKFHISTRLGQKDRALFISKADPAIEKLSVPGADTLLFGYLPSAFSLVVNNYYFTNLSFDFLFSKEIGFPYSKYAWVEPYDEFDLIFRHDITQGKSKISRPFLQYPVGLNCQEFYQPMFKDGLTDQLISLYDCDYVKQNSLDYEKGVGAIFRRVGTKIIRCSDNAEVEMVPQNSYQDSTLYYKAAINTLKWQSYLYSIRADETLLTKEQQEFRNHIFSAVSQNNRVYMKKLEQEFNELKNSKK
ncbi:hypothetical protein F1728_21690 [Gimesia benthica]|uniref:HNH endonuclease n=1 Tax=Gimesia benthica TaxID=2608982 RepID=A0A6I6AKQ8_9PLAN|nr:hypothetical protein [Gimesia benthica]QGQ25139.1 hypothetical protein F1728_21690 [Gimesia benthica]